MAALHPEDRSWGVLIDGIGGIGKTALAVEVAYLCLEQALFHIFLFATAKQTRLEGRGEEKITDTAKTLDGMLTQLALTLGEHTVAQLADAEKRRGLISALRISSGPARRILVLLDNLETLRIEERLAQLNFSGLSRKRSRPS